MKELECNRNICLWIFQQDKFKITGKCNKETAP